MEKTVSRKVVVFAILLSLSCSWIAKASMGEEKTSGQVRDVTPQRGGPCSYDNLCHNHCPGCKFTQCIDGECVCLICYTPPSYLGLWKAKASEGEARVTTGEVRDIAPQRGGPCSYDNVCYDHCPSCSFRQCVNGQCVCSGCNIPPSYLGI